MGVYERNEITGIFKGQQVICSECLDDEEINGKNIIAQIEIENDEKLYFCDDCGERL
jgi:hypothetical protein